MEKKYMLGIDMGATATKTVLCENGELIKTSFHTEKDRGDIEKTVGAIRKTYENIEKIMLTGVGSTFVRGDIGGIPTCKIDEFTAMANGVEKVTGLKNALIIGMGTGTAFVRLENGQARHIGGSGVGGGTLMGLSALLTGEKNVGDILRAAQNGDLSKIDLQIRDIIDDSFDIPNLPKHATAANFGKISENAAKPDVIAGVMNMVCQTVGMLAVFACKGTDVRDVVLIGTLAQSVDITLFGEIGAIHGFHFIRPDRAAYICALGACRSEDWI